MSKFAANLNINKNEMHEYFKNIKTSDENYVNTLAPKTPDELKSRASLKTSSVGKLVKKASSKCEQSFI